MNVYISMDDVSSLADSASEQISLLDDRRSDNREPDVAGLQWQPPQLFSERDFGRAVFAFHCLIIKR
jgi:hypothetical protein